MLSPTQAAEIIKKNIPIGTIQSYIDYGGLYIFQVFTTRPGEEIMDPFYSVDRNTGEFSEFSILTDGNTGQIARLFDEAQRKRR